MKTLIELYDERPIENVLGTEMFRPKELVLLCPLPVEEIHALKETLEKYFQYRGVRVRLTIMQVSLLDASKVARSLRSVLESREDCAIDISGGTDASLFAAGAVSGETPVITYSMKRNSFFEIKNAPFARNLPCSVRLDVRSSFLMAGGNLLPGREDNQKIAGMLDEIDALFRVYSHHRGIWRRQISYIQVISSAQEGVLSAKGNLIEQADRKKVQADDAFFQELAMEGLILDLQTDESGLSFTFPNETVRFWLRDIGSVLELQVYAACLRSGLFDDVVLSAIVNWKGGTSQRNAVTNELDVVCVRGVQPFFISCKTNEVHTEALNELAVLRGRFGGSGSKAMIVTSARPGSSRRVMVQRASELRIEVAQWGGLETEELIARFRSIFKLAD